MIDQVLEGVASIANTFLTKYEIRALMDACTFYPSLLKSMPVEIPMAHSALFLSSREQFLKYSRNITITDYFTLLLGT